MKPTWRWLPVVPVALVVLVFMRYAAVSNPQWTMTSAVHVHDVGGWMTLKPIKSCKLQSLYDTMGCMLVEFPDYFYWHWNQCLYLYCIIHARNLRCGRERHMYSCSSTPSRCCVRKLSFSQWGVCHNTHRLGDHLIPGCAIPRMNYCLGCPLL